MIETAAIPGTLSRLRASGFSAAFVGAAACMGLLPAAAIGQAPTSREARSADARSMILGPLVAEMARAPGAASPATPDISALRFSADIAPTFSLRTRYAPAPAASLAGSLLTARARDSVSRDALAPFAAPYATLADLGTSRFAVSLVDGDRPGASRLGFDPAYGESAGRAFGVEERTRRMAVRYESSFAAPGNAEGLDVGLSPRAGVSLADNGAAAAEAGATVRLGRFVDADFDRPAWWFFAGADRQAVMYDPHQGFDVRDALAMEPYAIVGDAQAGVAMRMGGADLSVAYVHRETEYALPQQSWETSEGFAAFSLTWRR